MGKKQVDVAAADGAGKKKGKSNLLPAIVVAAGLLGGGYFMSGGGGAKAAKAAAEGATTTTTAEKHGEVVKLDSITLNLADGRFVKLGLALELKEGLNQIVLKATYRGSKEALYVRLLDPNRKLRYPEPKE